MTGPAPGLVVIGGSWGGFDAATALLSRLHAPAAVPLLLVLHRSRLSDGDLMERLLRRSTGHDVREIEDKQPLAAGTVYLAPPDYHVLVEEGGVSLSVEGPVNYSRPSVDLAFESAADEYAERLVAVVLTGAGRDGAAGIRAVHRRGGRTLVQDPDTALRGEMPRCAIATGEVDEVAAPERLGERLEELLTGVMS